jgi:SAM-dependent methyltransferase
MRGDWRYDLKRFTPKFVHPLIDKARPTYDVLCDKFFSNSFFRAFPRAWMSHRHGDRIRYTLVTDHPVAFESPDYIKPRGAVLDNSKNKLFNQTFYSVARELDFAEPYSILDLGCAGGGLIRTFIQDGHNAVGLEGTNYNKLKGKYEWGTIPESLFTCDITKPFEILLEPPKRPEKKNEKTMERAKQWLKEYEKAGISNTVQFDLITMWEVLEHIKKTDLPALFQNIKRHLAPNGLFICSISHIPDVNDGVVLHQTVEPIEWWDDLFVLNGFRRRADLEDVFEGKYLRHEDNSSYRVLQLGV